MGAKSDPVASIAVYYVGMHFVLCHGPVDNVSLIRVNELEAWSGVNTGTTISINAPDLFGGEGREGGVVGDVDIDMGGPAQTENAYLQSAIATNIPAFRGVVSAILNQVNIGHNYYLKPWSFVATRIHVRNKGEAQWQDSLSEPVTGLINAVHVIRDCFTDTEWGRHYPEALIDETSFAAAAQTCYDEGLAFGFFWDTIQPIEEFIILVAKHIQASVYIDRTDGKVHITLTRKLESETGLFRIDDTNKVSVPKFRRKSIGELASTIEVKFENNETYKNDTFPVSSAALMQQQNEPITKSKDYPGVTSREMAQKLAVRDLGQEIVPVYLGTVICDTSADHLNIGDPFVLEHPDFLENPIIMRVLDIDLGTASKQQITIECVEDYFSAADVSYAVPPESGWVDPFNDPVAVTLQTIYEAPYYMIAKAFGDAFAEGIDATESYIAVSAASPLPDAYGATLWTTTASVYSSRRSLTFCFTATVAAAIDKVDTTIDLANIEAVELLKVDSYILIEDEYLHVTVIGATTLTVIRGVLDTVPESHAIAARIWGVGNNHTSDETAYVTSETVSAKLTTVTTKGELDISLASAFSTGIASRLHRPYPPANVKIDTNYWPATGSGGSVTVTWATRDRIIQTAGLIGFYTGDITSEAGVTYDGELIRTDTLAVLDSFTGSTSGSEVLTTAYIGEVKLTIKSVRAGLDNEQSVTHIFDMVA